MNTQYTYNGITWLDLENPDKDEVVKVMEKYDLHPIVAEELLTSSIRPKVDLHDNCIYMILHFPIVNKDTGEVESHEIDFVVGKDFLITVHYNAVDPLHTFSKMFEVNSVLDKSNLGNHGGFILFYMLRDLYRSLAFELDQIDEDLRDIEDLIFAGEENAMVWEISAANRRLLDVRRAIRFHRNVLESFEIAGKAFFGAQFEYYLRAVTSEFHKAYELLESHKEAIDDLRDTNDSLLTTKTNNIIKILTIVAFTTIPLNLATQLLAMNTNVSFLQNIQDIDFFIILALTGIVAILMFLYFKRKRWL